MTLGQRFTPVMTCPVLLELLLVTHLDLQPANHNQ